MFLSSPAGLGSTAEVISDRLDQAFAFTGQLPEVSVGALSDKSLRQPDLFPDLVQRLKTTATFGGVTLGFDFDLPIPVVEIQIEPLDLDALVNVRLSVRFDDAAITDLVNQSPASFVEFVFDPIRVAGMLVRVGIVLNRLLDQEIPGAYRRVINHSNPELISNRMQQITPEYPVVVALLSQQSSEMTNNLAGV